MLTKIDGKFFWGTDGEIPTIATASVKVFLNGASISIPENAYDDLYEPRTDTISLVKLPDGVVYIKMFNSDGAGAYAVIWIFKDGKYYGRYIDDSEA